MRAPLSGVRSVSRHRFRDLSEFPTYRKCGLAHLSTQYAVWVHSLCSLRFRVRGHDYRPDAKCHCSVLNAASLAPGISPGAAAIVQGSGFSGDAALNLGGVKIAAVGGSVLPTRFNVQIPATVAPGEYQATVTSGGGTSAALSVTLTAASPAFYTATREGVVQGSFLDESSLPSPPPTGRRPRH